MTDKDLDQLLAEGRDEAGDSIVAELGDLRDDAEPSPSFTARVMRDVEGRRRGLLARARDVVLRPRTLRFNVAMALPLGVAATLIVAVVLRDGDPRPATTRDRAASIDAPSDEAVMVSFRLAAPGAQRVAVAGDFNDWNVRAAHLSDGDGDGIWTVTIPVDRGRHAYMFVVDDQTWLVDPDADSVQPDGFGGQNAVLRL